MEPRYECAKCLKKFRWRKHYTFHSNVCSSVQSDVCDSAQSDQAIYHLKPKYKCQICGKQFNHIGNYNAHWSICENGKYSCDLCGSMFKNSTSVKKHKRLKHPGAPDVQTNVQIDQEQNQALNNDLKLEIQVEETRISTHDDQEQTTFDGAGLEISATDLDANQDLNNDLEMEIKVEETKISTHDDQEQITLNGVGLQITATDLDAGCSSRQSLTDENQLTNFEEMDYSIHEGMNITEECKRNNIEKTEKSSAVSSGKNSCRPTCNICGITFSSYHQANYHKFTRHTDAKFECPYCSKKYHHERKFQIHTSICADRKFSCELCSQKLKTQFILKQHMRRFHNCKSWTMGGTNCAVEEKQNSVEKIDSEQSSTGENSASQLPGGSSCTKCPYCEKEFSNEDFLPGHIEQCHGTESLPGTVKGKDLLSQFACDICGIKCSSARCVYYHKRTKHDVNHKCPHCRRVFQMEAYQAHLPLCENKKYSCEICHSKFRTSSYLAHHKRKVHRGKSIPENEKRDHNNSSDTKCLYCDKQCSNAYILRNHIAKSHKPIKCRICGITVNGLDKSRYHKIMKHTEPRYECARCLKKFRWKKLYTFHSKVCALAQGDLPGHKCSHCGKTLSSAAVLARHVLINHEPVACDICGITLSSLSRAQCHQTMVHKESKHTCPHCSTQVFGRIRFQRHVSHCKSKNVPCEYCGKTFKHLSTVKEHTEKYCRAKTLKKVRTNRMNSDNQQEQKDVGTSLLTENSDKNDAPVAESGLSKTKCYYCIEEFSSPGSLQHHLKSYHELSKCDTCGITVLGGSKKNNHKSICHTEPKHKCQSCGRQFLNKGNYNAHRSICEHGKYPCELCGRIFKRPSSVKQHKRLEHPEASDMMHVQIDQQQNKALNNDLKMEITVEETTISSHDYHGKSALNPSSKIDASLEKDEAYYDVGCSSGQSLIPENQSKHHEKVDSLLQKGVNFIEEQMEKNIKKTQSESAGCSGVNSALQSHNGSNSSNYPFMCNICGIGFSGLQQANYHKLIKHTEAKFQCPHCSKRFHYAAKFKPHTSFCAGRKFSCELCSRKFKTTDNLKQHVRRSHGSKILFSDGISQGPHCTVEEKTNPEKLTTGCRGENSALELLGVDPSSGLSCTKCRYCEEEFRNEDFLAGHLEQCHLTGSQQHPTKHEESSFDTENAVLLLDQNVSSELSVAIDSAHDVQTDSIVDCRSNEHSLANIHNDGDMDIHVIDNDSRMHSVDTLNGSSERQVNSEKTLHPIVQNPSNQPYICNICGIASTNYVRFKYHKLSKHTEGKYPCPHCSKKCHRKQEYDRHVEICASRKQSCELCGHKFKTYNSVKHHMNRVHRVGEPSKIANIERTEEKQQDSVEGIGSEISSVGRRGKIRGINATNLPYICKICGVTSLTFDQAQYHKLKRHTEAKYQCPHCPKIYHRKQDLTPHASHCVNRKHICELCGQKYKTLCGFKKHMKRFHCANGPLRNMTAEGIDCTEEHRQYSSIEKIDSEKCSSGMKPVLLPPSYTKCPHCEKDFSKGGCLPRHIERCHVPRSCKSCGMTFANAEKLRYHRGMVHKGAMLKCPDCSKTFPTSAQYRLHLSKCKDKKFSCELCGVKFKSLQYVVRHKQIFHPDKNKTKNSRNCRRNGIKKRKQKQTKKNALEQKITLEKTNANLEVITDDPICGKNFSNQHKTVCTICSMTFTSAAELMNHKDTCSQQQSTKNVDFEFETEESSLLHGEKSSSGSFIPVHGVKEVQTDSTNMPQEDNIELKMEIQVENTMLQDQICQVSIEDQEKSSSTTSINVAQLEDSKQAALENAIKIKEEYPGVEVESPIVSQSATEPLDSRDCNSSLKGPEAYDQFSPCPTCGLTFSNRYKMKYHMVVTHTVPRYKCPHCSKLFHFVDRLRRHEKTHGNTVRKKSRK